ncbi:hypothetical protein J5X84_43200 [Streptosporangiaceae bacterium NEAU-GS5]|nr:hypothetical protein [Streptosporangiaceae bacterium NEAU-GS5]
MTTFDRYLHTIIDQAADEARKEGSTTVEAHHLLVAIATEAEPTTAGPLSEAGLGRREIRDALEREFEHSLAAVGVVPAHFGLPPATCAPERPSTMGASAKLALERGLASAARKKDLRPAHLLLGILRAEVGTVPRALALAGIDRAALAERVRQSAEQETRA